MRAGRFLISAAAAAVLGFTFASALAASSDYLLTISGVDGESRGHGHQETIEVASWSLGASNPTSVGSSGMSAGKVSYSDLTVMISLDKASPILAKACASGTHFKKVTLSMRGAGHGPRQTTSYYDAVCTALSPSSGGDRPTESVTFHYARMEGSPPPSSSATVEAAPAGVARPH